MAESGKISEKCVGGNAVKGNTQMTNQLYTNIAAKKPTENVFFSPISVHTILSLLYQGAEKGTATALQKALGLVSKECTTNEYENIMGGLNKVEGVTLKMANKVYVAKGHTLKPSFKAVATKSFFADAENIDFVAATAAAADINSWVEDKTNNKIKDLIKPDMLDDSTRLVLVNAIYFKGSWEKKFDPKLTKPEPFFALGGTEMNCNMMHKTASFDYKESDELDAKLIKLKYSNPHVSMVIILPNKKDGITNLEKKLQNVDLSTVTDGMYSTEVILSLPKFKIETEMDLKDPLKKMGFENIFSDAADFSGLLENAGPLKVSDVVQKAFIEVNEEGAEAAAATGVVMMCRSMPMPRQKKEFIVDNPFMFYLAVSDEDVEHQLFMGKFMQPPPA